MTTIRKIVTSKVDGNSADSNDTNEIRPFGEIAVYLNTEPNPDKLTLMMFDGTRTHMKSMVLAPGRLYGSDADSGDGNGLDTIKLIPDASLSDYTGNDQYLIIDPTNGEPGHIHIRAGGVQDQSTADLYLGAEQTHVKVSDTYDNVVIRTSTLGEGVTPHTWTFDNTGNLTLPNSSQIRVDENSVEIGTAGNFNVEAVGVVNVYTDDGTHQWQFGDDGNLTIPGELHGAPVISGGAFPSQVGRTVNITPADDASDKKFKFRIDQYGETFTRAYLEFPTAEVDKQVAAVFPHTNGKAGYIFTQGTDTFNDGLNDAFNVFYNAGDIKLTAMTPVAGTLNTWKFGSNGDLTLPGNLQSEGNIDIDINLSDSTLRRWRFGEDGNLNLAGNLQFPNGAEIRDVNGNLRLRAAPGDVAQLQGLTTDGAVDAAVKAFHNIETGSYVTINTNIDAGAPEHVWTFDYNGELTLPNDGIISAGGSGGLTLGGNFDVKIITDYTDNNRTWTFNGSDGSVTFPDTTVQSTAWAGGRVVTAPTASTGAEGDKQGDLAFTSSHLYYCIADYNQVGHQVTGSDYLGRSSLNTNAFQLTKTADTLQITVGDIISDSDGGATSTVVTVSSDENYTYVGTGGFAYAGVFPLTFTSTDYVSGGNIWKRVAWSGDTW
jgi:hypothetical protein